MDDQRFRFIYSSEATCVLCLLDTPKLLLTYFSLPELERRYRNDEIKIEKDDSYVIDFSKMDDTERKEFEDKKNIMKQITEHYGPTYIGLMGRQPKPLINQLCEQTNVSKVTLWKWIRKYIQSGLNDNSLVDTRRYVISRSEYHYSSKTGRPNKSRTATGLTLTPEVLSRFKEFMEEITKCREKTIKNAYFGMCEKYYSYDRAPGEEILRLLPESERPTLNQFYYYCKKNLSKRAYNIAKKSITEDNNDNRLLTGSSRTDAYKPGEICECDALEADFSIVSELDIEQSIGRPIVYMMIDVYSSMIVAVSVSFENNSYVGVTNLMLNLGTDKVEFAKQYGITISPRSWYSCFIPKELRCDRGADFKSDTFGKVCTRLNIHRSLEPVATGSMKGVIEQSFHQFQQTARPHLENKGLITKRYDSKHHREASITLTTFTQLLIHFIVSHNEKVIINYPMTMAMHKNPNFKPIPVYLWEEGVKEYGPPNMITSANRTQYIFDLMIEKKATISRQGLRLSNLVYQNLSDADLSVKCYNAGKNKESFIVRCDPRDVSRIYYQKGNELLYAELNPNIPGNMDYAGMSWYQYRQYNHNRKNINLQGQKHNLDIDYKTYQVYNWIIDNAISSNYANVTNLRQARTVEKNANNQNNKLSKYLPQLNNSPNNQTPLTQSTTPTIHTQVNVSPNVEETSTNDEIENVITNNTTETTPTNFDSNKNPLDNFFDNLGNDAYIPEEPKKKPEKKINDIPKFNIDQFANETDNDLDEFTPIDDLRDALKDFNNKRRK